MTEKNFKWLKSCKTLTNYANLLKDKGTFLYFNNSRILLFYIGNRYGGRYTWGEFATFVH